MEDEKVGWCQRLNGHEFSKLWELVMDREACGPPCSPWGHKESDATEQLNLTELIPPSGQPKNGKAIILAKALPKEWAFWAPHWALSPWVLHWEDKPPEDLAFRPAGLTFKSPRGLGGKGDSTLKWCTQNLTGSGAQGRSKILKEPGLGLFADPGESLREAGRNCDSTWEQRH